MQDALLFTDIAHIPSCAHIFFVTCPTGCSFDRIDDNYEGEVFDVAIPPPSLSVDGCDTLSYSGAYDRRISHEQYLPLNDTSISALPGPQLLAQTFEAPSSAAAADVGDGAFVVYNDGGDGEPFVLCLRRTVAFAGDLACVKVCLASQRQLSMSHASPRGASQEG